MNRTAKEAAARGILKEAERQMTLDGVWKVLTSHDTSATDYFKARTTDEPKTEFRPAMESVMQETGVVRQYDQPAGGLRVVLFGESQGLDSTNYIAGKAMDGLFVIFVMIGREEKTIRRSVAGITPRLVQVAGKRESTVPPGECLSMLEISMPCLATTFEEHRWRQSRIAELFMFPATTVRFFQNLIFPGWHT